ncbi:MAG: hypothetical protein Q7K29_03635 [Thermoleophilia bacterium]|nr:hypothetical protein [Thermoleophilia bacterium]
MNRRQKRWSILPLILLPLLVSLACGTSDSQTSEQETIQADVVFGPGAFVHPDTQAGLSDLTSYKASLTLSFDGTRDGKAQKWSRTYVLLNAKEPAARQLTIEKTGDISDPGVVFMAEVDRAAYEKRGENACTANVINQENSLIKRLEPAGFLNGVIGAEAAGGETVNAIAVDHYTFDERAFGQLDLAQSTGEMWVASNGGYIVKYLLTTKGNADYFGEGVAGTLTLDYELTGVNQPVALKLPGDCPAGMVNAPLAPNASNVVNVPSVLTYDTSTSLADVTAFYKKEIPALGWALTVEPTVTETTALMEFTQGNQTMTIVNTAGATGTKVHIVVGVQP